MKLTKYLHSCILLEENGKRLLIDPGAYSFIEERLRPGDVPAPNWIFITHEHADHFSPEALRVITQKSGAEIFSNPSVAALAKQENLNVTTLEAGATTTHGPFNVTTLAAEHGPLVTKLPPNFAYFVNERVLHPGDSLTPPVDHAEVLLLPVAGPWELLAEAIRVGLEMRPKIIIPIHEEIVKDFFLPVIYERQCRPAFEQIGIQFRPLGLGESIEF